MADTTFTPPGAADLFPPAIFGWVTKPMILVVLSAVIISTFFLVTSRRLAVVPGRLQFAVESIYDFGRNTIAREQIGGRDFGPYVPFIISLFTFVLVNNIFGIIPLIQFPTLAHIAFPGALAVLVVYPTYHWVGIRRHGLRGYLRNQFVLPGVPKPVLWSLLIPTEVILKFFFDPITLAIRVFAAMFAGHLLVVVFVLGGQYLLLEAAPPLKPVSAVSFALAIGITLLEALIQVLQAYIFATLSAHYIGRALAAQH
ncbi:F0F1 ATP synthase subunit A [Saccharothrix australiensis]|uniref:ATP synthase subunit a n=1 Tax=Saccharothrix australiensis TaxID=2072 RepID=A0A495W088_9PSEU|nr:F0F1 ATP synthase subunit A [Saccharothrix australiensis]RKT55102.1 ATP synthase F0 subcomplex A subunit [Saccharothrix australiensis]